MSFEQDGDFQNILTQLYSRKATKKAFLMIAGDFKKESGKDLCDVIRAAQKEIIKDINNIPSGEKGKRARTETFKLIDYSTWLRYCPVKREK